MSTTSELQASAFAQTLMTWYQTHGRHDLPWTQSRSPYHVWLSEIMLQQTQVSTVLGYFPRFITALPTLKDLAEASEDQVLGLWTGLGYYSRARNLHAAAKQCVELHNSEIPNDYDALVALPGIGRSTAGAILAQAFERPFPILDGNVKRVLSRLIAESEWPGLPAVEKRLWSLSTSLLPNNGFADYTQALMDLGATVCTRSKPLCSQCPVLTLCESARSDLTASIPAARPKRVSPIRSCVVVWMQNEHGAHYLEKRPAKGIWGALWSLPQFDGLSDAQAWLASRTHNAIHPLPAFRQVFTHFKLDITPLHVTHVQSSAAEPTSTQGAWVATDTLSTLGMPAPIRKLLES